MNNFTNSFLAIVILLSKLTCLREFFKLYISRKSTLLRSSLNTYITFQSVPDNATTENIRSFFFYQ